MENKWTNSLQRSAEQIKTSVLDKMPSFVPEITDYSDTNPFIRFVDIWANLFEMLHYYLDRSAEEVYPTTARKFNSIAKLAEMFDYRIRGVVPSTVILKFSFENNLTQAVTIPEGSEVATKNDVYFRTLSEITIPIGSKEATVLGKQWVLNSNQIIGTSNGLANQSIVLSKKTVEESLSIQIDSEFYTSIDTFALASSSDNSFRFSKNEDNEVVIRFGDGVNGRIPPPFSILASYYTSEGANGNVSENTITEIKTTITVPSGYVLRCTNLAKASGGSDSETIDVLRKRIPLHLNTLRRAVTEQDYKDLAQLVQGVEKSGLVYNGAKNVFLYIVPVGGGLATQTLLDDVVAYFDNKRMITTQVEAFSAGQIQINVEINIRLLSTFSRTQKTIEVKQKLLEFFNTENQEINGQVYLSDITEVIENIRGVASSDIVKLVAQPFPIQISPTTKPLNWTRSLLVGSTTTIKWRIVILSITQYQLFKNGFFIGNFTIGTPVAQTEVSFTVNADTYTIGDTWEFVTYKYSANIILAEPSIPTLSESDIILNVSGGVA